MDQQELREELKTARRALHEMRLSLARYGIAAPAHLVIEEQDQAKNVARLEAALDQPQTEPRILPEVPSRPRYVEPPRPAREFERMQEVGREHARQADIEHQAGLLTIHRRNLAHLRSTAKAYGGIPFAPIHIQNQMTGEREDIARIKDVLRAFYGQVVDDLAGDE